MPDITNPQVVDYANNYLRPISDTIARLYSIIPGYLDVYNERNLGTIINDAGAGEFIADGSEIDGRTRVTGGDVFNMVTLLTELHAFWDANSRPDVFNGWQVNGVK